jgi:hypothetical protein
MKPAYMSSVSRAKFPRASLVSRFEWYSRLARHAKGADRAILDARCHLLIKTILRRTTATPQGWSEVG